jgi:hypothetical protein
MQKNLNYDLAGGSKPLLRTQLSHGKAMLQVWYTGVSASDVRIELYTGTLVNKEFALVEGAGITLDPSKTTACLVVDDIPGAFWEFRLVAAEDTAGIIQTACLQGLVHSYAWL